MKILSKTYNTIRCHLSGQVENNQQDHSEKIRKRQVIHRGPYSDSNHSGTIPVTNNCVKFSRICFLLSGLLLIFGLASAQAPSAGFTCTPTGAGSLTISCTDQSTGNPTGWAWFFGDETYSQAWTPQTAGAGWPARQMHSSVSTPNGSIVLMAGYAGTSSVYLFDNKNDVWRSVDSGATWTEINPNAPWNKRVEQSSVRMPDGSIILMGGADLNNYYHDVWRLMPNSETWIPQNAGAPWTARYAHSSVVTPDGVIVLMGGHDSSGLKNDVWQSMDYGITWTLQNASAAWYPREGPSSVAMSDGSIVLMGGWNGNRFNDTWRSTDNGKIWTLMNSCPGWSERYFSTSVAMPDDSIVLMGGNIATGSSITNDVWRSKDNGSTWTLVNANPGWSVRSSHTSVAMPNGSIVLMGGGSTDGLKNDVWQLMPVGSTAQNPSHTYTAPGTYPVTLQVYNADGYNSVRSNVTVQAGIDLIFIIIGIVCAVGIARVIGTRRD